MLHGRHLTTIWYSILTVISIIILALVLSNGLQRSLEESQGIPTSSFPENSETFSSAYQCG